MILSDEDLADIEYAKKNLSSLKIDKNSKTKFMEAILHYYKKLLNTGSPRLLDYDLEFLVKMPTQLCEALKKIKNNDVEKLSKLASEINGFRNFVRIFVENPDEAFKPGTYSFPAGTPLEVMKYYQINKKCKKDLWEKYRIKKNEEYKIKLEKEKEYEEK